MKIVLSYPPKELSPNGRYHWAVKAKAAKTYGQEAYLATKAVIDEWDGKTPIVYKIIAYNNYIRKRDDDNIIAQQKSARDFIAQALGINDNLMRCGGVEWLKGERHIEIVW